MLPRPLQAVLVCLALVSSLSAQDYGLSARPAFTAYANGALPTNASSISGTWSTAPAWPTLTFSNPMGIVQEPGTQRMFVWEREGRVYAFDKATGSGKTLILDVSANTQGFDDCGLLNLVCHPNYATNGYVFIYYTWIPNAAARKGSLTVRPPTFMTNWKRLSRFTMRVDGTLDPASETVLMHQKCEALWHSGGGMFFHPTDGFLYFINGDDFVLSKAQTYAKGLHSGIFRIDVDQRGGSVSHAIPRQPLPGPGDNTGSYTAHYFIPNDNPLVGQGGVLEEYVALGVRSPHRLTFDAISGRMFHSDVGDASREEINVFEPGEVMPNYQWPRFEGRIGDMTAPYLGLNKKPILDYTHADGAAVIGGYVYRGTEFPELHGRYIFGDNMTGTIWYLDESTTPARKVSICKLANGPGFNSGDNYLGLSSFGVDSAGELYLAQLSTSGGRIYKLSRTGGNTNSPPATLSATGVFSDLATLTPSTGFIPYAVNTPFWSDGAEKQRWFAVPSGQSIGFNATGEWSFPAGSVMVKHFDLGTDETNPAAKRRLETRVLVRDNAGYVYGASYRWRSDQSDADLVDDSEFEDITITTASGTRTQRWAYPSRQACIQCHTKASGGVLGLNTRQLNGSLTYGAITDNQLRALNHVGYFAPALDEALIPTMPALAAISNSAATLEHRARSYLDSNCSHCHRPGGGGRGIWDGRFSSGTIVDNAVINDLGILRARTIAPQDILRSLIHTRMATATESYAMPPIGKNRVDAAAVTLISDWIASISLPTPQPMGTPWQSTVVGTANAAGSAFRSSDLITLTGAGLGITSARDDLQFIHRDLVGDGTLVARVISGGGEVGVMIRESTAPTAKFIAALHSSSGVRSAWRFGSTASESTDTWLRVQRAGSVFTASRSSNGVSWYQIAKLTITMAATTKIGLCISSGDASVAATAQLDELRFMPLVPWLIQEAPRSQLVRVGERAEFDVLTQGDNPTGYQWRRNNVNLAGAIEPHYAFTAALANAGGFAVVTGGRLLSSTAQLTVVDKLIASTNYAPGATVVMSASYAGTGASFQWLKNGQPLSTGTLPSLTITGVTTAAIGDYSCAVTAHGRTLVLGPHHLHVLSKPTITAAAPPAWTASRAFTWQLTADEPVSSYVVTGLPSGLTYNGITGLVSGNANVGGSFTVKVYARNAAGIGTTRDYTLNLTGFPSSLAGNWSGLVDRASTNTSLGGTLGLTIATNGMVTASLRYGLSLYSATVRAVFIEGSDPTVSFSFARPAPATPLLLNLTLSNVVTGTADGVPVTARHHLRTTTIAKVYNVAMTPTSPGNVAEPQGTSWVRITISAAGVATFSGRLADTSLLTSAHTLREDGSLAWFQFLHGNKGSLRGEISLTASTVTGSLDWRKNAPAATTDRIYTSFGPQPLTVQGAAWIAPAANTTFLGHADVPANARIEFTEGGISSAAPSNAVDQTFRLTAAHRAVFDPIATNPSLVNCTVYPTSGFFIGSFRIKDGAILRTITYQGIFLPGETQARGAFTLLQLPATTTSPILTGSVLIKRWP